MITAEGAMGSVPNGAQMYPSGQLLFRDAELEINSVCVYLDTLLVA